MNTRYTNHEELNEITFAEYVQIVATISPNWPHSDVRRLAVDCWIKKLDREQTVKETRNFLAKDTRKLLS